MLTGSVFLVLYSGIIYLENHIEVPQIDQGRGFVCKASTLLMVLLSWHPGHVSSQESWALPQAS